MLGTPRVGRGSTRGPPGRAECLRRALPSVVRHEGFLTVRRRLERRSTLDREAREAPLSQGFSVAGL